VRHGNAEPERFCFVEFGTPALVARIPEPPVSENIWAGLARRLHAREYPRPHEPVRDRRRMHRLDLVGVCRGVAPPPVATQMLEVITQAYEPPDSGRQDRQTFDTRLLRTTVEGIRVNLQQLEANIAGSLLAG
jgi:hypothetical protein